MAFRYDFRRFMRTKIPVLLLSVLASNAWAADPLGDVLFMADATALGRGGATRASPEDHANIQLSPSSFGLIPRYEASINGFLSPDRVRGLQASMIDSRTSKIALGVAYRIAWNPDLALDSSELPGWLQDGQTLENPSVASVLSVGAATSFADYKVGLGAGITRWWRNGDVAGGGAGWLATAGLSVRPWSPLCLALGGMLPFAYDNPRGAEAIPHLYAGLRMQMGENAGLVADLVEPLPLAVPHVSAGGELVAAGVVPLRLGYHRASEGQSGLTAGLSLGESPFMLDYGIRLDLWGTAGGSPDMWNDLGARISF